MPNYNRAKAVEDFHKGEDNYIVEEARRVDYSVHYKGKDYEVQLSDYENFETEVVLNDEGEDISATEEGQEVLDWAIEELKNKGEYNG